MTTLSILLNFWASPVVSGLIVLGFIYFVMILGGRFVSNNISGRIGKAIVGFGYISLVLGIIGIIVFLINN